MDWRDGKWDPRMSVDYLRSKADWVRTLPPAHGVTADEEWEDDAGPGRSLWVQTPDSIVRSEDARQSQRGQYLRRLRRLASKRQRG